MKIDIVKNEHWIFRDILAVAYEKKMRLVDKEGAL